MDCYLQAHKIDKDKELFPNAHIYLYLYSRFLDIGITFTQKVFSLK